MTFEKLKEIISRNNIPENVTLESMSGWEGGPTRMDGVLYDRKDNIITFTQGHEFGTRSINKGKYGDSEILYPTPEEWEKMKNDRYRVI